MKIENRQQFLIGLTVAAVALYVGVNFIYEPLQGWWSSRSREIAALRTKVSEGNYLKNREADIRHRWRDMSANTLPANTSMAEQQVLTDFDNWRRTSGVEITSILPQWKAGSTNYQTLNCRVEATGTLGTLSQFLYSVEKGPSALKLDAVELSAHDPTGQQLTLGLQISGLALLQPATEVKR